MITITKSRLFTYLNCPKRYWYSYVKKVKRPHVNILMQRGSAVHAFCEEFFNNVIIKDNEMICNFPFNKIEDTFVKDNALNFYELEKARWSTLRDKVGDDAKDYYFPIVLEKKILTKHANFNLCGIVDRVDKLPNGMSRIVEIKSGNFSKSGMYDKALELLFYKYLLKGTIDNVDDGVVVFTKVKRIAPFRFTTHMNKALKRRISKFLIGVKEENFEKKEGFLCNFCDYSDFCLGGEKCV